MSPPTQWTHIRITKADHKRLKKLAANGKEQSPDSLGETIAQLIDYYLEGEAIREMQERIKEEYKIKEREAT